MFAIMNEAGQFLPGGGRGGTWREFAKGPPRLFARRQDAENARQWWLGGPGRRRSYDEDSDDFYQDSSMLVTAAKRQAIAATIKVVEVELRLV